MHHQYIRLFGNERYGNEILLRIERQLLEQALVAAESRGCNKQRMTVARRVCHDFCANDSGSATAVIDDDLLAPSCGQCLPDDPRQRIDATAGCSRNYKPNRLAGVGLGRTFSLRDYLDRREGSNEHNQRSESAFHLTPPHLAAVSCRRLTLRVSGTSTVLLSISSLDLGARPGHANESYSTRQISGGRTSGLLSSSQAKASLSPEQGPRIS